MICFFFVPLLVILVLVVHLLLIFLHLVTFLLLLLLFFFSSFIFSLTLGLCQYLLKQILFFGLDQSLFSFGFVFLSFVLFASGVASSCYFGNKVRVFVGC